MFQVETRCTDAAIDGPTAPPNPAAVYITRLAPGSRRAQTAAVEWLAREASAGRLTAATLPWHLLRYQHTQVLRARLAADYAPATANRHLAALRGVLREAWRLGLLDGEAYRQAADLPTVRGKRLPAGRALDTGEVSTLFARCAARGGTGRARDAALFAVLFGAGLRSEELLALDLEDYHADSGALRVRRGKGNVERLVWITGEAQSAVNRWLEVRGGEPGPLFHPVDHVGRIQPRRISYRGLHDLLRRYGQRSGLRPFSPHDCRRTWISELIDAGADLVAIQGLAGHSSVSITARYDRRGERARRKAAALLRLPIGAA